MEIIKTGLEGLLVVKPKVFGDNRGYFFESFRLNVFRENGVTDEFVQDNESFSQKNVLRGLHYQNPPFAQGKFVKVVQGAVLDVAVDIRKNSPTFGKWYSCELSGENKLMMWIPRGFAHGFLTLMDDTIFQYKCTNYYSKEAEGSIFWNDPDLNINWQVENPIVSEKDQVAPKFSELKSNF